MSSPFFEAWIGLGSSCGPRLETLASACLALQQVPDVNVCEASSIYATSPVGPASGEFFNAALRLSSDRDPAELLALLLKIETAHGRERLIHWGDRTLDLDLLLVRNIHSPDAPQWVECQEDLLTLPHPRIWERDFVLVPLAELSEHLVIRGRSLGQWRNQLDPHCATIRRRVGGPQQILPSDPETPSSPPHAES